MSNSIVANRSALKEFLASIAVISGDLSNITAPPFVLAENSTTELPQYWADHPSLFIAPAKGQSEEERALLVLKWFLGSLKNQQHAGRKPEDGIKKPLNAFLGELFIGKWDSEAIGETRLVSEQVSHHPPVTACYLSNEKFGVRAEGFTCQEITFSGGVNIKQKGYAVLHLDQHAEDYLIPVPNVKVKGILSGTPYPELTGTYSIISSTRYVSEVKFEGKGMIFGGTKNSFHARVFHVDRPSEDIFQVDGQWSDTFTIQDAQPGEDMEVVNVAETESIPISVLPIAKQDPWESRRAWGDVIGALERGDMKGVSNSKSIVEEGQRRMRKDEQEKGVGEFQRVFFQRVETDPVFEKLSEIDPGSFTIDKAGGSWKANEDAIRNAKTPYHGELIPTGSITAASNQNGANQEPTAVANGEQSIRPEAVKQSNAQSDALPNEARGQGNTKTLETVQVEEFLRAKYTSSNR